MLAQHVIILYGTHSTAFVYGTHNTIKPGNCPELTWGIEAFLRQVKLTSPKITNSHIKIPHLETMQ